LLYVSFREQESNSVWLEDNKATEDAGDKALGQITDSCPSTVGAICGRFNNHTEGSPLFRADIEAIDEWLNYQGCVIAVFLGVAEVVREDCIIALVPTHSCRANFKIVAISSQIIKLERFPIRLSPRGAYADG